MDAIRAENEDNPADRAELRVPKIIHSVWLQGRSNAPELVRYNFERWAKLNPSYELRVLDSDGVDDLLKDARVATSTISAQGLSDIVRIRLLRDLGGVWADASVLPIVPLDDWIQTATRDTGFFAFERRDVPLSSWFLCASLGNPVVNRWWEEIERLWATPRLVAGELVIPDEPARSVSPEVSAESAEVPYFWLHCLFQYMLEHSPEVRGIWERRRRISAERPHALQELFDRRTRPTDKAVARAAFDAYVQKLDWRKPYPLQRLERLFTEGPPPERPSPVARIAALLRGIAARRKPPV